MSSEDRLRRLGLLHLKDKPDELQKELDRRVRERDQFLEQQSKKGQLKEPQPKAPGPIKPPSDKPEAKSLGLKGQYLEQKQTRIFQKEDRRRALGLGLKPDPNQPPPRPLPAPYPQNLPPVE